MSAIPTTITRSGRLTKTPDRLGLWYSPNVVKGKAPGTCRSEETMTFAQVRAIKKSDKKVQAHLTKAAEYAEKLRIMENEDEEPRSITPEAEVPKEYIYSMTAPRYVPPPVSFRGDTSEYNQTGTEDEWEGIQSTEFPRYFPMSEQNSRRQMCC